ncbi:hypothetical protein [Echinicola sediminis]
MVDIKALEVNCSRECIGHDLIKSAVPMALGGKARPFLQWMNPFVTECSVPLALEFTINVLL